MMSPDPDRGHVYEHSNTAFNTWNNTCRGKASSER
jgi:hypothetical protein